MKKVFPKAIVIVLTMAALLVGMSIIPAVGNTPVVKSPSIQPTLQKNYRMTMKINGQKTGLIGDNIQVLAVNHSIVSPRDVASGLPTGQRMHKPLTITKEVDKTSPILMNVLCTNENLKELVLTFSDGNPKNTYTIRLTNASIASIDLNEGLDSKGLASENISFTYQKISWTYANGVTAQDDWEAPTM